MSSATLTRGSAAQAQRLTERPAWKALEDHYATMRHLPLRQIFADDPRRGERLRHTAMLIVTGDAEQVQEKVAGYDFIEPVTYARVAVLLMQADLVIVY